MISHSIPNPIPNFNNTLKKHQISLTRNPVSVLQVNVGKRCNQTCNHCHVNAGPTRTENMEERTINRLLEIATDAAIKEVDLTGGAPEMNPHFIKLVKGMRQLSKKVIVRSNLTIMQEAGYEWIPDFFTEQQVQVIASLPCYEPAQVNKQRGKGVFEASISAIKQLNQRGYGALPTAEQLANAPDDKQTSVAKHASDPHLTLHLVHNPIGPLLPAAQGALEAEYKQALWTHCGVYFNDLLTITNLPIGRFGDALKKKGTYKPYLALLEKQFNAETVPHLMCRHTLNIGWDGTIYDCDFNQMLEMPLGGGECSIFDEDYLTSQLSQYDIATGAHCFGCTAGEGSSCGGSLL